MSARARELVADVAALLGFALFVYGLFRQFGVGWALIAAGVLLMVSAKKVFERGAGDRG